MLKMFLGWLHGHGPRWTYTRIWLHALAGALALTALVWIACSALGISTPETFAENAAHELLQSLVLGAAVVAGVVAVCRCNGLSRYAAMVVCLISYVGFLRETPSCQGDVILFCAASDTRGPLMAAGVVALLVATVVFELRGRGTIMQAIHPRHSWPLALAAALIGASQASEHLHVVPVEETLELYSYLVLMLSAGWLALWKLPQTSSAASRQRDEINFY